ncbi:MAG: MBL fold metallo-hydrolase [bacterium]|nr:MBL fold metallo-hydrolase [bacterium]
MKVIVGGVRGSSPVSGAQYTVYGGDTTSLLVLGKDGERIVIDAGTGISNLDPHLGESGDPLVLLLSHFHLDHLMGFPNFRPLYQKDRPLKVVGMGSGPGRGDTWQALSGFVGGQYWPVDLREAGAMLVTVNVSLETGSLEGELVRDFLQVGNLEVRACGVHHPGGCLAWRIDEASTGSSLVFATDMEWGNFTPADQDNFKKFCKKPKPVSALFMDGHFNRQEYSSHSGWGHSTFEEVAQLGLDVGASQIGVIHHSPDSDDQTLDERAIALNNLVREGGSEAKSFFIRQGQNLEIDGRDDSEESVHRNAALILKMVIVLHRLGYERLRISPGMSPSGMYWRCLISHVENFQRDHGALLVIETQDVAIYSSGAGNQFFGWDDCEKDTPDDLARKFIERFPVICRLGRGDDDEYVEWYEQVIEVVEKGDLPRAFSDWSDQDQKGILPTVGGTGELPMPPPGEG